jgi:NADH-quinone oxidoreductase subunit C
MSAKLENLAQKIADTFGASVRSSLVDRGELTVEVVSTGYRDLMKLLRDLPEFSFEELVDVCGVDYLTYGNAETVECGSRFAVVTHLLSIANNVRLRVRVFAEDDGFPVVESVMSVWASANWFEREAFDLYGIVFEGHEDLRRILTDYGFVGHPFRKDFPISGHVEMRYDPDQGRVVYQPVTIEPRENTPRVVRESTFGG